MAIVIKEIILSDTIEKFMEKVNFNFDQLMLAGGGPQGPQGNIGPIGPIGPEGDPGNKWYVGCTGTTSAIGASLFMGDLFLQKGDCIGATYPLGEVLEFNQITQIFVPTGLNLRGPTGATGSTGTSTGWGVYPGIDTGSVYNGTTVEATPGSTASFVLMKGDTIGVTGDAEHPEYSKDTLYLGGFRGMSNQVGVYQKERLPKLFVSPKTILNEAEFSSSGGQTGAGLAGSGIALVREPSKTGPSYAPINQYSYSNIFIDDKMNLNITNFSDYYQALTLDDTVVNDINLMSKVGVKLLGGHYQPISANGLLEVSQALDTPLYPDTSGFFDAGGPGFHLRSSGNLNTGTISLEGTNQLRIISERTSGNSNLVDVAYWANVALLSPNNKYRIGIGANAKYKDIDDQISDMPFIGSGAFDGSAVEYIGLGNKPTGNKAPTLSTFNYSTKDFVLIGDPDNYNPSNSIGALVDKSIDIEGQIRMRYGASSPGQVLITSDSIGTAEWSPATSLGGWQNDSCDTKIIISLNDERFASFVPGSGINYTRVDIPSLNNIGETDVYFGAYSVTSGDELVRQGHIINKRYQDQEGNGVLAISTGLLKNCPVSITGREMQGTSTVSPRIQVGAYGEIVIGYLANGNNTNLSELGVINDVANDGVVSDLKTGLLTDSLKIYKSQTSTQNGSIINTQKVNRANIHLINTNYGGSAEKYGDFVNPKIKFTPDDSIEDGTVDGFVSTTAIEILRTHGSNTGSEGPANIRFLGVGKSNKTAATVSIPGTLPSNKTTGRGEDIPVGAHVMMISDVDAQNKYRETGKAYDYYELVDSDLFVETLSATFLNQTTKAVGPLQFPEYQYKEYEFAPWGTSDSGWNNITGPNAYKAFYGSRTVDNNIDEITDIPGRYNLDKDTLTWDPASSPKTVSLPGGTSSNNATFLNTWISPTTGVRFSPMNLSVPNGNTQTGLTWVDFNIDMGLIFEAATDHFSGWGWSDGYLGIANSLGTNGRQYDPTSSVINMKYTPSGALAADFKVKHIKVRLDDDKLGISSFLDNLDYSRRRNPLDPKNEPLQTPENVDNSADAQQGTYFTDWYVGQVKPMNNLRGLGKVTSAQFGAPGSTDNLHIDSSASLSWSYMSDVNGRIYPWASDPSNSIVGQYGDMVWGSLNSEVPIYANQYANFANNNKYTNFMWRIYTIYEGGMDTPKGCYLEIYCTPDAHRAWYEDQSSTNGSPIINQGAGNAYLNIDRAEGSYSNMPPFLKQDLSSYGMQQQRGGFYPNVITMFDKYVNSSGVVKLDLEALLTNAKRTHNFYETHGFSLSGQATVKWNRAQNEWNI